MELTRKKIRPVEKDNLLLIIMIALIGFGLIMIYSASAIIAIKHYGTPFYFIKRQLIYALLGIGGMILVIYMDIEILKRISPYLILASIGMLALVLIPGIGSEINHARRWFRWGHISFQPSEFAKLSIIIYLSTYLSRNGVNIKKFGEGLLAPLSVVGIITILIAVEPDRGTAFLITISSFIILYIAGARLRHILAIVIPSIPVGVIFLLRAGYIRERIMAFIDPWKYATTRGYQIIQSLFSFGKGGLWGKGIGGGTQKLFFLPEAHTDFIFAVIGEEMGFIGSICLILIFMFLLWRFHRIGERYRGSFEGYLATSILVFFFMQVLINLFVVTGLFPTKGLPLPFLSYGGSSLMVNMLMMGILYSISRRSPLSTQLMGKTLYGNFHLYKINSLLTPASSNRRWKRLVVFRKNSSWR